MPEENIVPQTTTALAVRGQLEEAQERLAKAEKKFDGGGAGSSVGVPGLAITALGAAVLLTFLVPPLTPIGAIVGATILAGGGTSFGIGLYICNKAEKNLKAAKATVAALEESAKPVALIAAPAPIPAAPPEEETHVRQRMLTEAAEAEIDLAFAKVQPESGLELPFVADDHSRKIVRIENLDTRKILQEHETVCAVTTVTARIYDAVEQDNGMLNLGAPVPNVPAFKRTVAAPEKRLGRT